MPPYFPGMLTPAALSPDVQLLIQDLQKDPTGGTLAINPEKGFAKFFFLRALGNNNTFTTALGANAQQVINFTAPPEENIRGDFEICAIYYRATGRFSTQIFQTVINRNFQNTAVPNNLQFGTSSFPSFFPETIYVPAATGLQLTITDLSGAANNIEIVGVGRRFLDWGSERMGDMRRRSFYGKRTHPYWLMDNRTNARNVAASGTDTLVMNVPPDADFNCLGFLDDSDFDYNMQIFEGLSSRALMDAQISAQSYVCANTQVLGMGGPLVTASSAAQCFGGGRLGNGTPSGWSHLFKRSSQININVTNNVATANNIRLALVGQLVYYQAPTGGDRLTLESPNGVPVALPLQGYGSQTGPRIPMGTNPGSQGNVQPGMGYLPIGLFGGR